MVHLYVYVPLVTNLKLKVAPVPIEPLLNTPLSLVTLCVTPSLFVHVIVVPAATVIDEGVNAIF